MKSQRGRRCIKDQLLYAVGPSKKKIATNVTSPASKRKQNSASFSISQFKKKMVTLLSHSASSACKIELGLTALLPGGACCWP